MAKSKKIDTAKAARGNVTKAARLPRYIRIIHEIAQKAGFQVDVSVQGTEILCTWRGTKRQLRKTRLVRPSYHFPLERGAFAVPPDQGCVSRELSAALVDGELLAMRGGVQITAKYPRPESIEERCGAEVCKYASTIAVHGTEAQLLASGLCEKRHISHGKRPNRSHHTFDNDPQWATRRLLDGTYLHVRETEAGAKQRHDAYKAQLEQWTSPEQEPSKREPPCADPELAQRLSQVVAEAERDFERSGEIRSRNYDKGKGLCARIVNGVRGRAHGWCVDFKGTSEELIRAGLAHPDWFKAAGECKRVLFAGKKIELYRPCGGTYELSIEYPGSNRTDA